MAMLCPIMECKAYLKTLSDLQLVEIWEATDKDSRPEIPTVRGWIMGEIERRNPDAFFAFLDGPGATPLRAYILKA